MTRRIVDLSIAIEMDVPSDPPGMEPKITYTRHETRVPQMASFFPGLEPRGHAGRRGLGDRARAALDPQRHAHGCALPLSLDHRPRPHARAGDRRDAARPVPAAGREAGLPRLPDGYVATRRRRRGRARRASATTLQPLDIVLVNTRAGEVFGKPEYIHAGCGMGREATLYLTERGVRVVGTDAWSLGRAVQPHGQEVGADARPEASSGKATRPAAKSRTGRWRSWPTSRPCRRSASRFAASRSRSTARRPVGRAWSRSSMTSTAPALRGGASTTSLR